MVQTERMNPFMTWKLTSKPDRWGDDPCFVVTYFSGAIERISVTHRLSMYKFEVIYADSTSYHWELWDNNIFTSYNHQFGISVSFDGRFLFVQTWDKGLFCYDARTGVLVWRTKRRFGITTVFVNENTLAVHQHDRALQLLDMETGEVLKEKKPARDWGFYLLDKQHFICHTSARNWEIIRAADLETVEIISHKQFPDDSWCIRYVYLESGKLKYEAFRNVWENGKMLPNEETEGYIEIHYQEVTP